MFIEVEENLPPTYEPMISWWIDNYNDGLLISRDLNRLLESVSHLHRC